MELNKRGISGVIVAVLMILLVIAAVSIFWTTVKPFIEKGAAGADKSAQCLTVDLSVLSAKNNSGSLVLQVKKEMGDAELTALNIYVDGALKSPVSGADVPATLETKTITITGANAVAGQKVSVVGLLDGTICGTQSDEVTVISA